MLATHVTKTVLAATCLLLATEQVSAQYQPYSYQQQGYQQGPYQYAPAPDYYQNNTAEGTVVGGGFGAIAGALIGAGDGKSPEGALIGAVTGAVAGNLLGRSKDKADQRQATAGYNAVAQANQQASVLSLTNYDLIQLSKAGMDDTVILNAIQTRGGRFDLSPNGLIALKQAGVSDSVLIAAQRYATQPTTIVTPTPPPLVVRPAPVVVFRPYPYHGYHWHGGHHCRW